MHSAGTLRTLLDSPELTYLMEAHDGISALLAKQAGFQGLWASGLSISTALGHRDANELASSEMMSTCERIADVSQLPVLVDMDTGYGNFNNARLAAKRFAKLGIAGICIEDKLFPKTNSFIGDDQQLAPVAEFIGKLRAVRDMVPVEELVLVARVEALIANRGMQEAIDRAHAYASAGADAVLIHSKKKDGAEILEFLRLWTSDVPIVLVPTTYYKVPASELAACGASCIIWANHNIRASTRAMQAVCTAIYKSNSTAIVETEIAPVSELFALLDYGELAGAEGKYLPQNN